MWVPGNNERVTTIEPHADSITSLRWTSNDRVLASGARDGTVALSEASGRLFHTLDATSTSGATVAVLSLTWSPGSRYLAAGGSDTVVRIFDLQKRTQALVLRGHRAAVRGIACVHTRSNNLKNCSCAVADPVRVVDYHLSRARIC